MSSLTQDYDSQSSDDLLSIWECDKVDRRVAKGKTYHRDIYNNNPFPVGREVSHVLWVPL